MFIKLLDYYFMSIETSFLFSFRNYRGERFKKTRDFITKDFIH